MCWQVLDTTIFGGYADQIQQMRVRQCRKYLLPMILRLSPSQTCSVFDKDGKLISERRGDKNAQYVKYEDIPKDFVAAIISIEDKKFYQHNGVDLKGLVRAVKATVMSKLKNRRVVRRVEVRLPCSLPS